MRLFQAPVRQPASNASLIFAVAAAVTGTVAMFVTLWIAIHMG